MLDEITEFDSTYDPQKTRRGLYVVPNEADNDVRVQFKNNEASQLNKPISSLKACQLCHSVDHTADVCTNMHRVQKAERYANEDVFFTEESYRNPYSSAKPRNVGYPAWENQRSVVTSQNQLHQSSQPYRHPGYQIPEQQPQ